MSDISTKKNFPTLILNSSDSGSLLHRFLGGAFSIPFSLIGKIARSKKIRVNGKVVTDLKFKLSESDKIEIFYDIKNESLLDGQKRTLPKDKILKILSNKIHEDENLLCINKPHGISVQDGTGVGYDFVKSIEEVTGIKLFIVHRIDKETAGIFVLAKNLKTAQEISRLFKENAIKKEYFAVVSPIPEKESDVIKIPIEVDGILKDSITRYKIIKRNFENNSAILAVYPESGRKHQIRIHLWKIGCPIVGDKKYFGNTKISKNLKLFANKISIPGLGDFDLKFNLEEI